MCVALAAVSAFAKTEFLARLAEVGNRLVFDDVALVLAGSVHHGADRDTHIGWLRTAAVLVFSLPVRPALRADQWFEKECHETRHIVIGNENNIPALAAIAAVRAAVRDVFLPAETAAPIAPVSSLGVDTDFIDEFHEARNLHQCPRQVDLDFARGLNQKLDPSLLALGKVIS